MFVLCDHGLPFVCYFCFRMSCCETTNLACIRYIPLSLRGEVSMCCITFKTPTMQMVVGSWGSTFGSSASSVPPSHTWSHFSFLPLFSFDGSAVRLHSLAKKNRKLENHKVPTKHEEQKQKTPEVVRRRPNSTVILFIML